MAPTNLSAAERETIVTMNDEDGYAEIWTAQRPIITKLKANPSAELIEEGTYGTTAWAKFRLRRSFISFRSGGPGRKPMSPEQREAAAERLRKAREAKKRNPEKE